jgi:hypothetical protein
MKPEERRLRRRLKAFEVISKNEQQTGTRQSFGTGAGAARGPNRIPHKVREAIASANRAINDGESLAEVVRNLAAMGLADPDTFKQVLQKAPRLGEMAGSMPLSFELVRQQPEPTLEELAMYAKLPVDSIKMFKKKGSPVFRNIRERYMLSRMTPGERRVVDGLQTKNVRDSFEAMTGKPFRRKHPPRRPRKRPK